jgi:uncharacterized membrane protein
VNIWLRSRSEENMLLSIALSVIGVGMIAVSGWLGDQMVHVYGVAVETRE